MFRSVKSYFLVKTPVLKIEGPDTELKKVLSKLYVINPTLRSTSECDLFMKIKLRIIYHVNNCVNKKIYLSYALEI